jgi:hypothetical protein
VVVADISLPDGELGDNPRARFGLVVAAAGNLAAPASRDV